MRRSLGTWNCTRHHEYLSLLDLNLPFNSFLMTLSMCIKIFSEDCESFVYITELEGTLGDPHTFYQKQRQTFLGTVC